MQAVLDLLVTALQWCGYHCKAAANYAAIDRLPIHMRRLVAAGHKV
jgi:hypothetical protein